MLVWTILPGNTPELIHSCKGCGGLSRFICGNKFRVNSNGKSSDVWLIYKCRECNSSLNISIMSKVNLRNTDKHDFNSYIHNDTAAVKKYAFKKDIIRKNKAVPCYDNIQYEVDRQQTCRSENDKLRILNSYDIGLRLDKLLSNELGVSRDRIRAWFEAGSIKADTNGVSAKTKILGEILLQLSPEVSQLICCGYQKPPCPLI